MEEIVCTAECTKCKDALEELSNCFCLCDNQSNPWDIMEVMKMAKFLLNTDNYEHLHSAMKACRTTKRKRNPKKEGVIVEPFWSGLLKFVMKNEAVFLNSTCSVDENHFDAEFHTGVPIPAGFPLIDGEILLNFGIESDEIDSLLLFVRTMLNSKSLAYRKNGLEQLAAPQRTLYEKAPKMGFCQVKTTFKEIVENTVTSTTFKTLEVNIDGTEQKVKVGLMDLPKYPLIREKIQFLVLIANNKIKLRANLYNNCFPYLFILDGPAWKRFFLEHCFEKTAPCSSLENMKDFINSQYTKNTTPKKFRLTRPIPDILKASIMPSTKHQATASNFTPNNKASIKAKTEELIEAVERMELHHFSDQDVCKTLSL